MGGMMKKIFLSGADDLYHLDMLLEYKIGLIAINYCYVLEHRINTKILGRIERNREITWLLYFSDLNKINKIYNNWGNSGLFTFVVDPPEEKFNWNGKHTLIGPHGSEEDYSVVYIDKSFPSQDLVDEINRLHTANKEILLLGRRNALKYNADMFMVREWMASEKFGTTFIFSNDTFSRISPKNKNLRSSHTKYFQSLGLNASKIVADDREENLRLSILSWKHYINYIMGMSEIFGDDDKEDSSLNYNTPLNIGGDSDEQDRSISDRLNKKALTKNNGENTSNTLALVNLVTKKSGLSRPKNKILCDSCSIKDKCDKFTPGSVCCLNSDFAHFQDLTIPGLLSTMKQLIEEQTTRLSRAIFLEEHNHGGQPTTQVNTELTRLQRNYHQLLAVLQEREKLSLQKSNLLKEVFGDMSDIIDAEEVEEVKNDKKETTDAKLKD
jgi:hypothetical protein